MQSPFANGLAVLIFVTLIVLMLTQTYISSLRQPLETARWVPLILLAAWPVAYWLSTETGVRCSGSLDYYMWAWLAASLLTAFYSIAVPLTIGRAGSLVIMYVAVFWGVWLYVNRHGEESIVRILLASASVIYVLSWLSYLSGWGLPVQAGRFRGIMENPNTFGILTAILLPLALARALEKRSAYTYGLVLLMIGTLILSGSRGGVLAAMTGSLYIIWKGRGGDRFGIGVVIALTGGLALYSLGGALEDVLLRRQTLETGSGRIVHWELMLGYVSQHPLLGHGFGTEDVVYSYYGVVPEARGNRAFNAYIGLAVQVGVPLTVLFFAPLFYLVYRTARIPPCYNYGVHAFNAVLISGLLVAVVEGYLYAMGNSQSFPFWIAIMLLLRRWSNMHAVRRKRTANARKR